MHKFLRNRLGSLGFSFAFTALIFFISRLIISLRTTYDVDPLYVFMQYVDPELIRDAPFDTILNNRNFPPGPSILYLICNIFPSQFLNVARLLSVVLSFLLVKNVFRFISSFLRFPNWLAFLITSIFWTLNTDVILMENTFHYAFYSTCFLILSLVAFASFQKDKSLIDLAKIAFYSTCFSLFRGTLPPLLLAIVLLGMLYYGPYKARSLKTFSSFTIMICLLWNSIISANYLFRLDQITTSHTAQVMMYQLLETQVGPAELTRFARDRSYPSYLQQSSPFVQFPTLQLAGATTPPETGSPVRDLSIRAYGQPNWGYEGYVEPFSAAFKLSVDYIRQKPEAYLRGLKWQTRLVPQALSCQLGFRNQIEKYDQIFRSFVLLERGNNRTCGSIYTERQEMYIALAYFFVFFNLLSLLIITSSLKANRPSKLNSDSRIISKVNLVLIGVTLVFFVLTTFLAFGEQARYKFEYFLISILSTLSALRLLLSRLNLKL